MNPLIGITTSLESGQQRLDLDYVQCVEIAGGVPVLLPMVQDAGMAEQVCASLAGLLIPGGPGITMNMAGSLPEALPPVDARRWHSDVFYWKAAGTRNLPVLGICYGMQLMNVLCGGTLYADVERQHPGAMVHSEKRGAKTHPVKVKPDSYLNRLVRTSELQVNSRHLQAVEHPGAGLEVSARSPDGVIEAIESPDGRYLGVQFHPEKIPLRPLFSHLVTCAKTC